MKKMFIGVWHPSVIMTYVGMVCSIIGIGLAMYGNSAGAMICLVLAASCDMFDGVVARCFKRTETEKDFGVQIDSLVDVCSFVVFPSFMLLCLGKNHIATYIVAGLYGISGVARLAWFNITTHEAPDYFIGLPVIYSALLLPSIYLCLSVFEVASHIELWIWCSIYILLSVLFICNFQMRKPRLLARLIMLVIAISLIVLMCIL